MRPLLWKALLACLSATAALALWPEDDAALVVGAAPRRTAGPSTPATTALATTQARPAPPARLAAAPTPDATPLPTRPGDWPAPAANALAAWQGRTEPTPAATQAVKAASAPRPRAEFPYRWIGQLDDGSGLQVLLANAQRSFGVREGDVVDQRWRIDRAANGGLLAQRIDSHETVALRATAANP